MAEGDTKKDVALCQVCGEPMPEGEEMFNYHGYSGGCPKPPLAKDVVPETLQQAEQMTDIQLMQSRVEKVSRVAREIEAILVREGMTWGEWGEVVETFSGRIGEQVALTKITKLD